MSAGGKRTTVRVVLWGTRIGAVSWDPERALGAFEYEPAFLESGIEVAPLHMPLRPGVYAFPGLAREAFRGLPGLLADVLPDRFGNAVIDAWLARQGRTPESFDPVERLAYTGSRGMGALEFVPSLGPERGASDPLDVAALVELASEVLAEREALAVRMAGETKDADALADLLRVGTSAGGARAKAVVAWNEATGELRSGQVALAPGFMYWILKFDGVRGNRDRGLEAPQGYGRTEYAYHRMARAAGIEMTACRLLEENGRAHFMTRRFDRDEAGGKRHLASLAALDHLDFNLAGAHAYEGAALVMRRLGLPMRALEELTRRLGFNVLARNQDDHVKNLAFLMDKSGTWSLSPAYDVIHAFNPEGAWTARHQMSVNGKLDGFERADFEAFGKAVGLKRGRALALLDEVGTAVARWEEFAQEAGIEERAAAAIGATHRLELASAG